MHISPSSPMEPYLGGKCAEMTLRVVRAFSDAVPYVISPRGVIYGYFDVLAIRSRVSPYM